MDPKAAAVQSAVVCRSIQFTLREALGNASPLEALYMLQLMERAVALERDCNAFANAITPKI